MLRWHDRCAGRPILAPGPPSCRQLRGAARPQRRVSTRSYRSYNEMMSRRTREYLHDGDEPIGDYLYDPGEEEAEEDEEALLDAKLRLSSSLGKRLTVAALQRAYTGSYLPPRFIGNVKLVATKSERASRRSCCC